MHTIKTLKCTPHIKTIEWEIEKISGDSDNDMINVNIVGKPLVDYLEIEIIWN